MTTLARKRREQAAHLASLAPSEFHPHHKVYGVLLSDEIIFYAENHNMIDPFDRNNLKPTGYELTVGNEYL